MAHEQLEEISHRNAKDGSHIDRLLVNLSEPGMVQSPENTHEKFVLRPLYGVLGLEKCEPTGKGVNNDSIVRTKKHSSPNEQATDDVQCKFCHEINGVSPFVDHVTSE